MKAVIQAGGKGTRMNNITGNIIPKPMLEVDGYPILWHQMMNLKKSGINDIVLIIGYLGQVIKEYFDNGEGLGLNIEYIEEDPEKPLGTAGALYYLKEKINEDFIFLLADVFIDINFQKMINFHKEHNSAATLLTHPNSHPFDSDLVVINDENEVISFDYKTNDRMIYDYNNLVNAGIIIFSSEIFKYFSEPKKYNYEKDIIVPLISEGKVYSYRSTEYAKDMGTPERYERVQNDYINGICRARNMEKPQKCIFLDRDGTINKYYPFLKEKDKLELFDGVSEAIKKINNSDYLCIVITNQPIIARGESTIENLNEIHKRLETLLGRDGAYIDGLYYCPHHPDKGFVGEIPELKIDCDCRKPKTGMITKAVKDFNIDLSKSYMIGDSTLDIQLGKNANIKTILLKTGQAGMDGKYNAQPDEIAKDLLEAIDYILERSKDYGFQKSN